MNPNKNQFAERHARNEALLKSIGDGMFVINAQGIIIKTNHPAEKILRMRAGSLLGKSINTVILKDINGVSLPSTHRPSIRALTTKKLVSGKYQYLAADQSAIAVAITAAPIILGGECIGVISIFRDITKDHEVDQAKNEFVSLAAHQMRTPLSTINWYLERVLGGSYGALNDKQQTSLSQVYQSSQRMVELIGTFLNISRIELGTYTINREKINLTLLMQRIVHDTAPRINEKKLRVIERYDEHLPLLFTDSLFLNVALQNVLSNAVKFTPEQGEIKIGIRKRRKNEVVAGHRLRGDRILLSIADTGYGIAPDQQKQIFTKMYRTDSARQFDTTGTGLGLYLAKSIMKLLGGSIWFQSPITRSKTNVLGGGTVFYLTFPYDKKKIKKQYKH